MMEVASEGRQSIRRLYKRLYKHLYKTKRKALEDQRLYDRLFAKYRQHTMLEQADYVDNLALATEWLRKHDLYGGCVIECGTWRGGVSFGMVEALPSIQEFHCFDSFEGLPKAGPLDGEVARRLQDAGQLVAVNNVAAMDEFISGMNLLDENARSKIAVHRGWFEETLKAFQPQRPISLLRIDCDWYASVMTVLDKLFDQVQRNGLIIIDDYMAWDGCARAVHEFLAKRQARERIQQYSMGGVSFLAKEDLC